MKIEIKHRWNGSVLFVLDVENNSISVTLRAAIDAKADLRDADLICANLSGANLSCADLRGAYLCHADLSGANLRVANLRGADLSGANLCHANLSGANLSCANLRCADLRGADLCDADLYGANMYHANLPSTHNIFRMDFGGWSVCIDPERTHIGCQTHSNEQWLAWSPDDVAHMADGAREYWERWGDAIKAAIRANAIGYVKKDQQ